MFTVVAALMLIGCSANISLVTGTMPAATSDDNVVYGAGRGWSHPECGMGEVEIAAALPVDYPLGDDME